MPRIGADLSRVTDEDMNRTGGWKALENGQYRFKITETEYRRTKAGDGMCLHISVQCVEPEHSRSHWREFLTLEHPNPQTVQIAQAKLKQLAVAVGHPNPDYVEMSEDLHNRVFVAVVSKEPADDPKYGDVNGDQNRIVEYKPLDGGAQRAPEPPQQSHDERNPPPASYGADDIPF